MPATDAQRPPSAGVEMSRHFSSPTKSPKRRALGELTPNVRTTPKLTTSGENHTPKTNDISPLKQQQALTSSDVIASKDSLAKRSPASGHKRSFAEFEGELQRDSRHGHAGTKPDRSNVAAQSPAHADPQMSPPVATGDDMDQDNDLSTTEEDTVSLHPAEELAAARPKPNGSFSSLIDYDPANASDHSARPSSSPSGSDAGDSTIIRTKTELLRLRLKVAMYKVETNQTRTPMSQLRLPSPPGRPSQQHSESSRVAFIEAHALKLKTQAATTTAPAPPVPKLLPAPKLIPTAHSAKHIYARPDLSSSSTDSAETSPERLAQPPVGSFARSPVRQSATMHAATSALTRVQRPVDEHLTSHAVKGRAASSLLELMKGC